jgi:8-oxo-dGTP pyrophosphatase MutT (NUDIX family)
VTTPPGPSRRIGLRARHARRVTPEHVGERVSLRRWVEDPERGPVQSDVVGRLLAFDEELLLLVDRRRRLHVVETGRVLSSRVVPPHPRMEDEPGLPTREAPLERDAARVLLLDPGDRVLLVSHLPDSDRRVWTAPGGGLEPDEDHPTAARRELAEELGLEADPGPWVWSRTVTFPFRGVWLRQRERWYLVRADVDVARAPLVDAGTDEARWWTLPELASTDEVLAPRRLAEHLTTLLEQGPPDEPVDVGT